MRLVDYLTEWRKNIYNEEIKEKYFKRCYEIFVELHCFGFSREMEERAKMEGIAHETIVKNAKMYMIEFLGMTEEDYKKFVHEERLKFDKNYMIKESIRSNIFLELMKLDDDSKIINLLEESKINLDYLHSSAAGFVCTYFPDKKYLIDDLRRKINICRENVKKNRSEKRKAVLEAIKENDMIIKLEEYKSKYSEVKKYIEEFINSDYHTKGDYCKVNGLLVNDFDEYVEIVRNCDDELYQRYVDKNEKNKKIRFAIMVSKVKQLIFYIENGIKDENEVTRPFDIIDYYQFMGIDFNGLYKIYSKADFCAKEWMVLKRFIANSNVRQDSNMTKKIMNMTQEVDCKRDSSGNLIPGTGRIVDIGEKERIISFLEHYGVPLNQKNYSIAFKRYKNNNLFVEDGKLDTFVRVK